MQTALTYRTNRDLFSNYYLDEHLPRPKGTGQRRKKNSRRPMMTLWISGEREGHTARSGMSPQPKKFIRPMFRKLGIPFEVEESTDRTQRRPTTGSSRLKKLRGTPSNAVMRGGDFYKNSVAVADAKRWGRPLDTRGSGEHERDFENPSYQIHVYLQEDGCCTVGC